MIRIDKIQIDDVQLDCDDECKDLEDDKSKEHSKQKIILNLSDLVLIQDNPRQLILILCRSDETMMRLLNKCLEAFYGISAAKCVNVVITHFVKIHNVLFNFLRQQLLNYLIYFYEAFNIVNVSVTRLYCEF